MAHYASKLKSGGTQGYGSDRDRRSWSNLVGHFLTCDTRSHEYLSRMIRCSATGTLPGRALGVGRPKRPRFQCHVGDSHIRLVPEFDQSQTPPDSARRAVVGGLPVNQVLHHRHDVVYPGHVVYHHLWLSGLLTSWPLLFSCWRVRGRLVSKRSVGPWSRAVECIIHIEWRPLKRAGNAISDALSSNA